MSLTKYIFDKIIKLVEVINMTTGFAAAGIIVGIIILFFILFELWYRTKEYAPTEFLPYKRTRWEISKTENIITYTCELPIRNFSNVYEATVVDVIPHINILYKGKRADDLNATVDVIPMHKEVRDDGYWPAYIIPQKTALNVKIVVKFKGNVEKVDEIHAGVIKLDYKIYGRRKQEYHSVEIILIPEAKDIVQPKPIEETNFTIFPVKTHILSDIDDIAEVIHNYSKDLIQKGDVVAVAESVVAITQRRYKRPDLDVKPGWWASRLCFLIPNVGSLSSSYGMQSAIDEVGLGKMIVAFKIGALFKLFGQRGWFYTIAGKPSELIDDLTGTMPPYDKYIVSGPQFPEEVVRSIKEKSGIDAAVVDVNNLKRVCILACTDGVDKDKLSNALINNPSGNACEQTPFVIIRYK